jgi:hypothetical protein
MGRGGGKTTIMATVAQYLGYTQSPAVIAVCGVTDCLVLGLPLDVTDDDPIHTITPLSAMVVVKGLDENGEVMYCTGATESLKSVECLGMAELAVAKLKRGLMEAMEDEE